MLPPGASPPGPGMGSAPPGPQGGTGAAMQTGPMQGSAAQGMAAVKMGLEALQNSLTKIPMGSDLHTEVLKAITNISKHMAEGQGGADPSSVIQQLVAAQRQQQQQPPPQAAAMHSMFPPAAGGGAQPPAAAA